MNTVRVHRGPETYVPPHLSKDQDIEIRAGDRVEVATPGGGGYGPAVERDPERVASDVRRGYYTVGEAESLFFVKLAGPDLAVDRAATERLRAGARP